jgi:putative DNA primase/helicase
MSDRNTRTYSAQNRAESLGLPNPAEERLERELRQNLIITYGEPAFYKTAKGEMDGIRKISPRFFAGLYGAKNDVLWEAEERRFYEYESASGIWRWLTEDQLLASVSRFMLAESRRNEIATNCPSLNLEEMLCLKSDQEIMLRLKAVSEKGNVFKRGMDFMHGERKIHFANGVFLIRDGKPVGFTEGFDKLHYSRNRCPVNYDPRAECPRFVEWLKNALDPLTAEADIDALFGFIGMSLLGHNLFQKILVLHGAAQSGKSTFSNLLIKLLGVENTSEFDSHAVVTDRFAKSAFLGKTLLYALDVDSKFLVKPGASELKKLTGGDPMRARLMFGGEAAFNGTLNAILTMNADEPRVRLDSDADAWRRRLIVIRFVSRVKNVVRDFDEELIRQEGSGIVNQALRVILPCITTGTFPLTSAQQRKVDDMLDRSDAIQEFVLDRIEKRDGASLTKKEIREAFKNYCKDRRWSVPGDRDFGSRLPVVMKAQFGVDQSNSVPDFASHNVQGYRGVEWRTD